MCLSVMNVSSSYTVQYNIFYIDTYIIYARKWMGYLCCECQGRFIFVISMSHTIIVLCLIFFLHSIFSQAARDLTQHTSWFEYFISFHEVAHHIYTTTTVTRCSYAGHIYHNNNILIESITFSYLTYHEFRLQCDGRHAQIKVNKYRRLKLFRSLEGIGRSTCLTAFYGRQVNRSRSNTLVWIIFKKCNGYRYIYTSTLNVKYGGYHSNIIY